MGNQQMDNSFLRYLTFIMLYTGTLPLKLVKLKKNIYTIYRYVVQTCSFFFLISMCVKVPHLLNDRNKLLGSLNILFTYTIMCIKVVVCLSRSVRQLIYEMVATEENIKTNNDKKILGIYHHAVQRVTFVQWFTIIEIYGFIFPFLLIPFVKYYVLWDESKYNSTSVVVRPLPYSFWLPFDETEHYLTGFGLSCYCAILAMGYYCFTQSIFIILSIYASFRLKVLKNYIENIKQYIRKLHDFQKDDDKNIENIFRFCIIEHIDIIRTVTNLNAVVKYVMLLEFLLSSAEISSVLFEIISTKSTHILIFSLCHFFLLMTQLWILYWHANEIRVQSVAISTALYEIEWYKYNRNIKRTIQIMMRRAQKPLSLTIGPFGEMSLEMAVKIFKAAYTYVTFLQHTYGDK